LDEREVLAVACHGRPITMNSVIPSPSESFDRAGDSTAGLDSFDLYVRTVEQGVETTPDALEVLAAGVVVDNALRVAEKIVYARLGLSCRSGESVRGPEGIAWRSTDPAREAGRDAVLRVAERILDVWTTRVTLHRGVVLSAEPEPETEGDVAERAVGPMVPLPFQDGEEF
jgi:hypothetical protein